MTRWPTSVGFVLPTANGATGTARPGKPRPRPAAAAAATPRQQTRLAAWLAPQAQTELAELLVRLLMSSVIAEQQPAPRRLGGWPPGYVPPNTGWHR